jgi:hypothetical protein
MKSLLFPIALMAAFICLVMALTPSPQVTADTPAIVEYIDDAKPVVAVASPATGPSFKPPANNTCNCGDFDALEKRVAALESKVASYGSARPVASNGSVGNGSVGGSGQASVSRPVATAGLPYGSVVVSERIVSSQPIYQSSPPLTTTTRTGLFGRTVTRSVQAPQTCRIVNGVRICN